MTITANNSNEAVQKQGYSFEQIRGFLAKMNITVSRQTIHDFIKRREAVKQKSKLITPEKKD